MVYASTYFHAFCCAYKVYQQFTKSRKTRFIDKIINLLVFWAQIWLATSLGIAIYQERTTALAWGNATKGTVIYMCVDLFSFYGFIFSNAIFLFVRNIAKHHIFAEAETP